MHFSDFSRSSDSSGSREARASMVRLLSYWQYYHRKISPSLESFIHLWSQGFHLSSIIKSSPSSSHYHHVITIIIKSTSPYHHVITIIITSSPQSVKITFIIASAGKDCISWNGSQTTERKGEKSDWLSDKVNMQYAPLLHNHKIAWVGRPLWTLCTDGALCTQSTVHIPSWTSFGHTSLEKRCTSWPLRRSPRRGWLLGRWMTGNIWEG